jgi:putative DNA primase/helicase
MLNPKQKSTMARKHRKDEINEENWGGPCRGGCGKYNQGEFVCADCRKKAAEKSFALKPGEVELYRGSVGKPEDKVVKQIVVVDAASLEPDNIEWVWQDRIVDAAVNWCLGQPNNAKSVLTVEIAACASTGRDWPDKKKNTLGAMDVLMYCGEDSLTKVVIPRLIAAGADLKRIKFLDRKSFRVVAGDNEPEKRGLDLTQDLDDLLLMVKKHPKTKLLIVDPITGVFGDKDIGKNKESNPVFEKLIDFCEASGVAFVGVLHMPKLTTNSSIDKIPGGSAVRGSAKSAFMVSHDTDSDNRYDHELTMVKWNYTGVTDGLKFKTVTETLEHKGKKIETVKIVPGEATSNVADDVLAKQNAKPGERDKQKDKCEMFLMTFLADGPQRSPKVYAAALSAGRFSDDTVKRALKSIGGDHIDRRDKHEGYWMTLTPGSPFPEVRSEEQQVIADVEAL